MCRSDVFRCLDKNVIVEIGNEIMGELGFTNTLEEHVI